MRWQEKHEITEGESKRYTNREDLAPDPIHMGGLMACGGRILIRFLLLYVANGESASKSLWYTQHLVTMASKVAAIRGTWWAGVSFLLLYAALGEQGSQSCCYTQYLVSVFLPKSPKPCQKPLIISFWVCFWRVRNHCFSCPWQWNQWFCTIQKHTKS